MAEKMRLLEDKERSKNWKRWGPYLSERQWGTVREDYSADGNCWNYLSHDKARSQAYRWGEDGLLGICDRQCRLCFALALWNGKDPILKERLFGLTGPEGNHGEDVKENYYYLDSTPTHSYMKALYKYPQNSYPYADIVQQNRQRNLDAPEYEVDNTGAFDQNKYWDVAAEYAKEGPNHILCKITDKMIWKFDTKIDNQPKPDLLFTENETNTEKLYNMPHYTKYYKDAFHRYVVNGEKDAVSSGDRGTKTAVHYVLTIEPGSKLVDVSKII